LQHYLFEVWSRFRQNQPVESSVRTGSIILTVANDVANEDEQKLCLLIKLLSKLSTVVHGNATEDPQTCTVTVLEEAIELLSVIGRTFAGNLKTDVLSETMRDLRYNAVLMCCQKGEFDVAEAVMTRQWKHWKNSAELEKRNELRSLVSSRKVLHVHRNVGQCIVDSVTRLLAPVMIETSFLVQIEQNVARAFTELESRCLLLHDDQKVMAGQNEVAFLPASITSRNSFSTDATDMKPNLSVGIIISPKRVKPSPLVEQLEPVMVSESQSSATDGDETESQPLSGATRSVKKSARVEPSTRLIESDDALSELSINFEETPVGQSTSVNQKAKRAKKNLWGKEEEELVYQGVKYYGVGHWAEIKKKYLPKRSNVDVKDKWRTMTKQKDRLRDLMKKFGPIQE